MRRVPPIALLETWILLTACLAVGDPALGLTGNKGTVRLPPAGMDFPTSPGDGPLLRAIGQTAPEKVPDPFLDSRLGPLEKRLFSDAADGRLDEFSLLEAALVAGGVARAEVLRRYTKQWDGLVEELRRSGEPAGRPRQRAQVVFEFMHGRVLHGGYRIECTGLSAALDHGRFNCVSASVLFNCLAGRLGLSVCGLEMPSHAMSRVFLPDGPLDVETTCPSWFRLMDHPERQAELVEETIGRPPGQQRAPAREISAVQMTAMIYYNRGVDLLAEGQYEQAAVANAKALRLDPPSATARGNLLATINNWAIALGRSGDYAEAAELLEQGLGLKPDYETFALNYVHVHHQRVEQLCGAGRFEEALGVLARAAAKLPDQQYFQRAPMDVYRRWSCWLFEQGQPERALGVFAQARRRHGVCRELLQAEVAAVNDWGLVLLERGQVEEAVALFDRELTVQPDATLLRDNRRVALMRWAEPAFDRGDYAEAIRRTTYGAGPGKLHASLLSNVRYGYHRWIADLLAAGHRAEADQVARQALADPYLRRRPAIGGGQSAVGGRQ